jgi:hypothetical protein
MSDEQARTADLVHRSLSTETAATFRNRPTGSETPSRRVGWTTPISRSGSNWKPTR